MGVRLDDDTRRHSQGRLRPVPDAPIDDVDPARAESLVDEEVAGSPGTLADTGLISRRARCHDPRSSFTDLFFSENPHDIARAKAICSRCTVRDVCLAGAVARREAFGVWGGECFQDGEIVAVRRGRGRPRKNPVPILVDEINGAPLPVMYTSDCEVSSA